MKSFSAYMQEWLYSAEGYYAKMPVIGKDGDFYTSVSSSMFFGGSIANHLLQVLDGGFLSPKTSVVEIGAHRGYLLADMIQFIFTLRPELLGTLSFYVVEPLENVRLTQQEYFLSSFGDKLEIHIVESLDDVQADEAYIVANELFDAFACEIIYQDKMLYIDKDKALFDSMDEQTRKLASKYSIEKGELPLGLDEFASALGKNFSKYNFVIFDYGEFESRGDFSLRVYKSHKVYPFFELTSFASDKDRFAEFFANADITYDVNFSIVKQVFEKYGASMEKYSTQMFALNDFGIASLLEILYKNVDEQTYKLEANKAKRLLLPEYFGERFKCCEFKKE